MIGVNVLCCLALVITMNQANPVMIEFFVKCVFLMWLRCRGLCGCRSNAKHPFVAHFAWL